MSRRASIYTLGCRLNQAEAGLLQDQLRNAGYRIVDWGQAADIGIINTCTVTGEADAKSRKMVRAFIRRNPNAFTAVVGCYSQLGADRLAAIDGVDLVVGNRRKLDLLDLLQDKKREQPLVVVDDIGPDDFTIETHGDDPITRRMNLKVQDGCDFMCSYCIVPYARGRSRSREMDDLCSEARRLVERGAKEIVLNGINLGTYRHDERDIADVADRLNDINGLERIRISSIDMTTVPERLFEQMDAPDHALVPFLHLPLQSGATQVLKRMNRRYTREQFLAFADHAAARVRDLCIGSDILVGFPGETDADFEQTCSLLEESPIAYAHVFKYSDRKGAPAAQWDDKVDPRVVNERSARVRTISARELRAFMARYVGRRLGVLFESREQGRWAGYTENYIRVTVPARRDLLNTIRPVNLTAVEEGIMLGELVDD